MMATYSERIKELRTLRSMSQQDLADLLGVSNVTVSQYERGVRRPNIEIVSAMCDIFNVSSDYLLGEDDVTLRFVDGEGIKKLDGVPNSGHQNEGQWYINKETARIAQEIFEDPDKRALFDAAQDSRPEDIQMAAEMLTRLKRTNPDG